MAKKPLRCFVAMPFGRSDTDQVYDQYIQPAIEAVGLIPIRVDRIVHNDRIDQRIREEIKHADVLIADLTYARPSVYWEAGYGERSVPVIYTCRKDHFSPKEGDITGNLVIHFDLANANIIAWPPTGSAQFKNELIKRLKFVLHGKRAEMERVDALETDRRDFSEKSGAEQLNFISQYTRQYIIKSGYKRCATGSKIAGGSVYLKTIGSTCNMVILKQCYQKLTKNDLTDLQISLLSSSIALGSNLLNEMLSSLQEPPAKKFRIVNLVPTISTLPNQTFKAVFDTWRPTKVAGWYYQPFLGDNRAFKPKLEGLGRKFEVLFADRLITS
jgi:nucleoside 2-deoxyribosyltransferase